MIACEMKIKWSERKQHNRDLKNLFKSETVKSFPGRRKFVLGDVTRKSRRRGSN